MSLTRRSLATLLLAAAPLALQAQDLPSRFGLGFAYVAPQGDWKDTYDSGWNVGLHVHFNREGNHEQRLRIDFIGLKEFKESGRLSGVNYTVKANAAGVGVGYDWLPRVSRWGNGGGFHFVLGVSGISWAQKVEASARSPYGTGYADDTDTGFAFSPTVGFQVRFNKNVNLEARYTLSKVTASTNTDLVWENLDHVTVGVGVRF